MLVRFTLYLSKCLLWTIPALGLSIAFSVSASAQLKSVYETPIYSPDAKSYFELVAVKADERWLSQRGQAEVTWRVASSLAAKRTLKGVKGRLAVVSSLKVHQFLLENFRPRNPAWIGASYDCKKRQLKWSDGHLQRNTDFQAWDRNWDQSGPGGCINRRGEADYMPVAYTGIGEGFRWIAKGANKEYTAYFVEYPTGGP